MSVLYDAYGRPIRKQELQKEFAAPTLAGVRTIWDNTVASGLTPQKLASLLRAAAEGDHFEYLTLAEEMEERELHYQCELGKRKLAVSQLPIHIEAASDEKHDQKLADEVREIFRKDWIRDLLFDLLDGLGKGFSATEIKWDTGGNTWSPAGAEWRDPRFFQFDQVSRKELRLRDEANLYEGIPLPGYKFIVHVPKLKSGIPIRGGIARLAAWAFMCKGYTIKDWMAFAEVFGMPLRLGKYHSGATEDEIDILKMAVANLGSDAAAVFPQGMEIEFPEAQKLGSINVYEGLGAYLDKQISLGILGQTATTEGTPGKLGGEEARSEVRADIRDNDARQLAATLNRDLVKPFIDLNFGIQENYPQVELQAIEPEDLKALSEALGPMIDRGLKVKASEVRDRFGMADPDGDDDVLAPMSQAPMPATEPDPGKANNQQLGTALNQQRKFTPEQQALEDLADEVVELASDSLAGNEAFIVKLLLQVNSYDEAMIALLELYPQLQTDDLEDLLNRTIFASEIHGRHTAATENA